MTLSPSDKEEIIARVRAILDMDDVQVDLVSSCPTVRRSDGSFGPDVVTTYEVYITAKKKTDKGDPQ